jgi:hypothetical protein
VTGKIYRPEQKLPEPAQHDLNPDAAKGLNWGLAGQHPEKNLLSAKDVHALLSHLRDDELDRIPILPAGARLESNATYVNLRESPPREFTAEGSEEVGDADWIVPKTEVDYQLWNRLLADRSRQRFNELGQSD